MKKIVIMAACAMMAVAAQAQNNVSSNWFVSGGANYNMFYTGQEKGLDNRPSLFDNSRSTMGLSVAVGKWISPNFGLRTKFSGIWGRYVTPDATGNLKNKSNNAYKYWGVQEQLLFNVSNLLYGYNDNRLYNLIPYVGFGMTRNMTGNDNAHGWSAGLYNTFKVNRRLAVYLDLGMNLSDDRIFNAAQTNHQDYGTTFAGLDRNFTLEVGVTYHIGRMGWHKDADHNRCKTLSQQEIDELNERLRAAEASKAASLAEKDAQIAQLQQDLAACQAANAEKATATNAEQSASPLYPTILFRVNKTNIRPSQYPALETIAKYMRQHPEVKLFVKGYASPEGDAARNQTLSVARAKAVRQALIDRYQIAADRLTAEGFGATADLFDKPEFNRVVIFCDETK